jgi:hypothetical protein
MGSSQVFWSLEVFFRELSECYESFHTNTPAVIPELAIQYADYAAWQGKRLQEESCEKQLEYWEAQLAGAPSALGLHSDFPRRGAQSFRGAWLTQTLGEELSQSLKRLAKESRATPFQISPVSIEPGTGEYQGAAL